ncbi:MAG: NAD(P)H-dependent oxidoreductase [Candidatus Thermoplasmatota archaeon]
MTSLIIYAHPPTKGFCSYILKEVKKNIKDLDNNFEILDLYDMDYNPILKKEEHYISGNKKISKKNKEIQKKIKQSDKLIFIYPVWWGAMPAILKGFLDRVITPGFGFKYSKEKLLKFLPKKLLKEKKALVLMTMGAPRILYVITGNPPKRIIKNFTLKLCGIQTKVKQIFNANRLDAKKERELKKKTQQGLKWLYPK